MAKLFNQNLSELSYYKTGGSCSILYLPESLEELAQTMREIAKLKTPYFLLGLGSNSLVMDEPWSGAVVCFSKLNKLSYHAESIFCEAGVENSVLSRFAYEQGLSGLAWMYRLPGQIGGTVRMNARCYGGEIGQFVSRVQGVSQLGVPFDFKIDPQHNEVFKGYKDTLFMHNSLIVGSIELKLKFGDKEQILKTMTLCEQDRVSKGQFLYPTCGCVFKNDYSSEVSVSSGLLLEKSGVKPLSRGKASISPHHANFVYNQGASSRDILELTIVMREKVWEMFGVWLEYEVEFLGKIPDDLKTKISEKREPRYKSEALLQARTEFQKKIRKN